MTTLYHSKKFAKFLALKSAGGSIEYLTRSLANAQDEIDIQCDGLIGQVEDSVKSTEMRCPTNPHPLAIGERLTMANTTVLMRGTREPRPNYEVSLVPESQQEAVGVLVKTDFDGHCDCIPFSCGSIPLDFSGCLADTSSITPAPPIPLVGEAHLGRVFLCAVDQTLPLQILRCHQ